MRQPARPRHPLHLPSVLLLLCLLVGGLTPRTHTPARAQAAALRVRAVSPASGAREVAASTAIVIAFDRPVVALSALGAAPAPFSLVSTPALPGRGRWLTSAIYTYQAANLRAATVYTLAIPAALRAIDGTRLAQPYTWRFTTVRPAVQEVLPADGEQYALPRAAIAVTFNQRMDHAATQTAFRLRDSLRHAVSGTFSWRGDTMRFQPAASLLRSASYTASIDAGARSADGPLPLVRPANWRFTVAPYLRVSGTTPRNGGTLDPRNDGVEIDFTAPITLTADALAHIHIVPNPPYRYISPGQDSRSLHIYGTFSPSTAYTVTIDAGLRSQAGDALRGTYRFHFVTAPLAPTVAFDTGPMATYDAYRPVVLSLQAINPGPITYTIYRLDQIAFLNDLADQYDLKDDVPTASAAVLTRTVSYRTVLNQAAPLTCTATLAGGQQLPAGYYFAQATGQGEAADYQLLVVTRISLTLKLAPRQVLLWATELRSGQPVPGVALTALRMPTSGGIVYPRAPTNGAAGGALPGMLGRGRTGADGTLLLRVHPTGDGQPLLDQGVLAIGVYAGAPVVVSSQWSTGISPFDYGISADPAPAPRRLSLVTDRPLYRPGQDVQVRGLVRADDDGRYSLVSGAVALTLSDPQGHVVARRTLALDRFGAFHTSLALAADAALGYYSLNVSSGAQDISQGIQVADYRKPTFAVTVTPQRGIYVRGQTIDATIQVQYYFGGPVTHARAHWSLLGYDDVFASERYGDYSFGAYDPGVLQSAGPFSNGPAIPMPPGIGSSTLYQGDAVTDARGMLRLRLPARLPKDRTVQGYNLEANVTDLDNEPVAGAANVMVYASAVQVGLLPAQQVVEAATRQQIQVVTLRDDGRTPAPHQAVTVEISRRTYRNQITRNADGSVSQNSVPHDVLLRTLGITTDAHGRGAFGFDEPRGGDYHLVATVADRYGNRATSAVEIYVGGEQPIDWGTQPQGHIRLIPDRRLYQVGDVAHILVATPAPGMTALVSIERGAILSYAVRVLAGTSTVLDVPIADSSLPDTYVSVVVEQGAGASGRARTRRACARWWRTSPERSAGWYLPVHLPGAS